MNEGIIMKRINILLAVIVTLSMVSCKNTTDVPAQTGSAEGTTAPAETVSTEAVTTEETTVVTTVETTAESTTAEAAIDPDAFLEECTVYEVTSDMSSYHAPYKELQKMDDADKPEKIALRFTDIGGLTILMELVRKESWSNYCVKHIFNNDIDILVTDETEFIYQERTFWLENCADITIINCGYEYDTLYYIINGNKYDKIRNNALETDYVLEFFENETEIIYKKTDFQFYKTNNFPDLVEVYESNDDFYSERGRLVFENGEAVLIPESTMSYGEWYQADEYNWKHLRDRYGAGDFAELAEIYRQYESEGRGLEFFGQ